MFGLHPCFIPIDSAERYTRWVQDKIVTAYGPNLFQEFGTRVAELALEATEKGEIDVGFKEAECVSKEHGGKAAELEALKSKLHKLQEVVAAVS